MVYRPPFLLPFGSDGAPPASVRATVDASPAWWQDNGRSSDAAAGAVIDSYGSEINQFVQMQRQGYAAGIVAMHRRAMSFGPDLDVFYTNQQGREAIHYLVRPESTVLPPPMPPPELPLIPLGLLAGSTLAVVFFDGAT